MNNHDVIVALESALSAAQAGELIGIELVLLRADGSTDVACHGEALQDPIRAGGGVFLLALEVGSYLQARLTRPIPPSV